MKNFKKIQQEKMNKYVESISNLDQIIPDLETIIEQNNQSSEKDLYRLNQVLKILGEKNPLLAIELIEKILEQDLHLKNHLGFLLAGIRLTEQKKQVENYIDKWINTDDSALWIAITISCQSINWSQSDLDKEYKILYKLVNKKCSDVDLFILRYRYIELIFQNQSQKYIGIKLLKILATREDENVLKAIALTLILNKKWLMESDNIKDFITIVNNFVRLSHLNYEAQQCLIILGEIDPWHVINLIKRRLQREQELSGKKDDYYDAIPISCNIFNNWKFKPEYPDILRHLRDWILEENFIFAFKIFRLIKNISPQLKTYLDNDFEKLIFNSWQFVSEKLWYVYILNKYRVEYIDCQLYEVLMEWVNSNEQDQEKLKIIARMLKEFNEKQSFYDLSREIIIKSQGT